jgi:2-polyprenyl-3-methyl-5-hydroxy-6-metoxy-1,4-benzoquinol methylase
VADLDPAIIEQKAGVAFQYAGGAFISAIIHLGDTLGLYRAMDNAGPMSSDEVAKKAGLDERFVREWLYQQTAAGILDRDGAKFVFSPEASIVFGPEKNEANLSGLFGELPGLLRLYFDVAPQGFRTGLGGTYDSFGEAGARMIDRFLGAWNRHALVPQALPKLDGVVARLEAGAKVADVGCGAGAGPIAIAKAFPKSDVHGYDNSKHAIALFNANKAAAGVTNVQVHDSDKDPLPLTPTFDFVTTLDCLHDMARPDLAAAAIRKAIKPDGAWFIADIESGNSFEENLANPLAGFFYAASIGMCLQSSASTPDGMKLGTVGLPEAKMRDLVKGAGFTKFERVAGLENPMNAYYVARP